MSNCLILMGGLNPFEVRVIIRNYKAFCQVLIPLKSGHGGKQKPLTNKNLAGALWRLEGISQAMSDRRSVQKQIIAQLCLSKVPCFVKVSHACQQTLLATYGHCNGYPCGGAICRALYASCTRAGAINRRPVRPRLTCSVRVKMPCTCRGGSCGRPCSVCKPGRAPTRGAPTVWWVFFRLMLV